MSVIGSPAQPELTLTSNERADPDRTIRMPLLRWTYGLLNRLIMVGDAAIFMLSSLFLVIEHPGHDAAMSLTQALLLAVLEAAVFLLILSHLRRYRFENYERPASSIPALIPGLTGAWGVGMIYFMAFRLSDDRLSNLFLYWHVPQLAALVAARLGAWALGRQVHRRGLVRRTVVLIGANPAGEAILANLLSPPERSHYDVVRVFADTFDPHQSGTMLGVPIANDMNMLGAYAQTNVVDLVIVALPLQRAVKSVELIEELHWIAADVVIPMDEIGIHPASVRLATIAGISTLEVLHRPLKGSLAVLKIAEDYVIASIALLCAAPFMLLIAVAIKLDSKGPVFFLQERTGFNTNSFWIYKFRTMTVDPDDDGSIGTMSRDNPRITRVGAILRRLSVDELPQLLNVLRGDMSVVGPRPYVPNMLVEKQQFRDAVRNCAYRYRLKPGITGLAQSRGMRSNALRSMSNAERSVEMDLNYIMNWSIWLDFKIMLQTVLMAMSGDEVF